MNKPAGYQLVVKSYAGDMDSWNVVSLEGLSLAKVKALKSFLDIVDIMSFYDKNFENQLQRATNHLFTEENGLEDFFCEDLDAELEEYKYYPVSDLLYELVGATEYYDYFNTLDNYSIYFHEKELVDLSESI